MTWRCVDRHDLFLFLFLSIPASGFALYTRGELVKASDHTEHFPLTFWDLSLGVIGTRYLVLYFLLPVSIFFALRQVRTRSASENIIRYDSRVDWVFAQGLIALQWIIPFLAMVFVIALITGAGFDFSLAWGPTSSSPQILLNRPELSPLLPSPLLVFVLDFLAKIATLTIFTIIIAAAATTPQPRLPVIVGVGYSVWCIFAEGVEALNVTGLVTYSIPAASVRALGLGPAGGIMVLGLIGAGTYLTASWWEVRRATLRVSIPFALPLILGAAVLLGWRGLVPADATGGHEFAVYLLQGVGTESLSQLYYLGYVLVALVPAVAVHRRLADSLIHRRYQEMIRMPSPARWYLRELRRAASLILGYTLVMGLVALVLVVAHARTLPAAGELSAVGWWTLALAAQVFTAAVALAFGTIITRRTEGGAYALGVLVFLTLPLGEAARWSPAGQASLARTLDPASLTLSTLSAQPLAVQACWFITFTIATLAAINHTRGEIL